MHQQALPDLTSSSRASRETRTAQAIANILGPIKAARFT
jgi:hypothetical protein